MFKYALSSYSSTYPRQERIETNGDGVKPGYPLAGHGGVNVQLGRMRPRMNIFTPSPFVSELYAHSCNANSEGAEYNDTGGADGILILSNPFTFVRA